MAQLRPLLLLCALLAAGPAGAEFDDARALEISQGAIGNTLGDHRLVDRRGRPVSMADLRGRPLLISLVYTSCADICSVTTRHLAAAVEVAQEALGADSFRVVTIGFDAGRDTPQAMAAFARQQGVTSASWRFLSADTATVERLAEDLGFVFRASPKGFDHLLQATLVDGEGRVHRQLYGELFQTPQLVEPLKQLVLGASPGDGVLTAIGKRVRLFCTSYDPASGRYYFDYSLFLGMAVGGLIIAATAAFLVRESLRRRSSGGT